MTAIDAMVIHDYKGQFQMGMLKRELNKVTTMGSALVLKNLSLFLAEEFTYCDKGQLGFI